MLTSYVPVLVFLVVAIGFALLLWVAAWTLGPKHDTAEKSIPYESGQDPAGSPRTRFSISFYRTAILFLVFDIEVAFFYPWAILYRELSCKGPYAGGVCRGGVTPFGLLVMVVFLSILVLALMFVWRKKALEWD
jgi:NADH-quinone oxidoreductase subunit A